MMRWIVYIVLGIVAALSIMFGAGEVSAQPCQWNYRMVPGEPNPNDGIATATYCGNVVVDGTITATIVANSGTITPQQFGARCDGVTDDTGPMAAFFAALNASAVVGDGNGKTCLIQYSTPSALISRDGAVLRNLTLLGKPGTSGSALLYITGPNVRLTNVVLDGNMPNMTSSGDGATYCLWVDNTGDNQIWDDVEVKNCNSQNAILFGLFGAPPYAGSSGHKLNALNVHDNANSGLEFDHTSNVSVTNSHFNNNGYGYQVSAPFPIDRSSLLGTDIGFNVILRFESHDIQFSNSEFNGAGRDGFNINQGSYNVLVSNSIASWNGDGGFTLANDVTAPSLPGDGKSPWNIRFSNNFAQGNYNGGIAAFSPVANLSVMGGAYWNNSRVQGDLTQTSSFFNNIYLAASSQNAYIQTSAYDDRQTATITSAGSCTFTVNSWTPGTYQWYPKVAFYNAAGTFQGYGQISAESAGGLTVTTLPFNTVTCASIASGWTVTQRVSHNGVFIDNGSNGFMNVMGSGFLTGPTPGLQGNVQLSGGFANGQNVTIEADNDTTVQLLSNPTMDVNITGYTISTVTANAISAGCESPGCMSLSGSSGSAVFGNIANSDNYFAESDVWVCSRTNYKQTAPGQFTFYLLWTNNASNFNTQITPQIVGKWMPLKICGLIPAGSTNVQSQIVYDGSTTVLIDQNSFTLQYPKTVSTGIPVTLPAQVAP